MHTIHRLGLVSIPIVALLGGRVLAADTTPPTIANTVIQAGQGQRCHIDRLAVVFSEAMQVPAMIADGSILSAVDLVRFAEGGPNERLPLRVDQFSYDPPSGTLTWSLNGSSGRTDVLEPGRYGWRLLPERFLDLAGNALEGVDPAFRFEPAELLQTSGTNINVNSYSVPSIADWNADNVPDLVVGEETSDYSGKVRVYLNAGTAQSPAYTSHFYAQSNGADLATVASGCLGVFPRVLDYDADGRKDLLAGLADGRYRFYRNTGTDAAPTFDGGTLVQAGPAGSKVTIDVGDRATLDIVDWNNDGWFDLVTGAWDGKVRVFLNNGLPGSPDFAAAQVIHEAGAELMVPTGRASVDVVDLDGDGRKDLVLGNTSGQVLFYGNSGTDAAPAFASHIAIQAGGADIQVPANGRARPFVCDANGDGVTDLLVGAVDGVVRMYAGQATNSFAVTVTVVRQGDFDGDGHVDVTDLLTLAATWARSAGDPGFDAACDLDSDGWVDVTDLLMFAENWGT